MRSNMLAYVLSIWIDFRTGWACSAISCRRMWVCVACSENKASATNFRLSEKTSTKRPGSSATQSGFNSSFFVLFTDKFMYDTEYISSGTSKNRKKKKKLFTCPHCNTCNSRRGTWTFFGTCVTMASVLSSLDTKTRWMRRWIATSFRILSAHVCTPISYITPSEIVTTTKNRTRKLMSAKEIINEITVIIIAGFSRAEATHGLCGGMDGGGLWINFDHPGTFNVYQNLSTQVLSFSASIRKMEQLMLLWAVHFYIHGTLIYQYKLTWFYTWVSL